MTRPASEILADLRAATRRCAELTSELGLAWPADTPAPAPARHVAAPVRYLTPSEAAQLLGVSTRTLAAQRAAGTGPAFVRIGRSIRYPFDGAVVGRR